MPLAAFLELLEGRESCFNWVFFRPPPDCDSASKCVVFFPGDLSAFPNARLAEYSWDALCWTLSSRFPHDWLVFICPSVVRMDHALYENFLAVDVEGNPRPEKSDPTALTHLGLLLGRLKQMHSDMEQCEITLVGFSKAGVVLNALLREAAGVTAAEAAALWRRVTSVHFVDCGLNRPDAFPLTEAEIRAATQNAHRGKLAVFLHGTSRQLDDRRRPHIREEFENLRQNCGTAGATVHSRVYPSARTLEAHFGVLEYFRWDDDSL